MIHSLFIILLCQLAGEMIVHFSGIVIPGPVVGMVILLVGLLIRGSVPEGLDQTTSHFLKYIGLLFVPAGAGISLYLSLIADQWIVILVASFSSTVLTLCVAGYCFQWLNRKKDNA